MINGQFILASRSPRRRRLLEQVGVDFRIHPSDVDESIAPDADANKAVQVLALDKANAVAVHYPDALTLGADTLVVLDGEILGKPDDAPEAAAMLSRLSGGLPLPMRRGSKR